MPDANEMLENNNTLFRFMCYGPEKTKKTWWVLRAAMDGFNVILFDADKGYDIVRQIPQQYRHKIIIVDISDTLNVAKAAIFMTVLLKGDPIMWDEQAQKTIFNPEMADPEHSHLWLAPQQFDKNTIVCFDSWTAITWSLAWRYAQQNMIDLANASKTEWEGYRWCGALADWMLNQIGNLPCHKVVVGHQTVYEKYREVQKGNKKERVLISQKAIMKSTSGPHGLTVGAKFSDILRFYIKGSMYRIDAVAEEEEAGGTRIIPPKVYDWDELTWKKICEFSGVALPDAAAPISGVKKFARGETPVFENINTTATPATNQVIDGSDKKKSNALANLLKGKPQS